MPSKKKSSSPEPTPVVITKIIKKSPSNATPAQATGESFQVPEEKAVESFTAMTEDGIYLGLKCPFSIIPSLKSTAASSAVATA